MHLRGQGGINLPKAAPGSPSPRAKRRITLANELLARPEALPAGVERKSRMREG